MSSRRRWRRLALRFLLILMLLAVALPTAAWLTLRASLPQYDGVVNATALSDRVIVERDALGTATIRAGSRRDADWALGYVHAQERFGIQGTERFFRRRAEAVLGWSKHLEDPFLRSAMESRTKLFLDRALELFSSPG